LSATQAVKIWLAQATNAELNQRVKIYRRTASKLSHQLPAEIIERSSKEQFTSTSRLGWLLLRDDNGTIYSGPYRNFSSFNPRDSQTPGMMD
jgi:hypothetical protein